MRRGDLVGAALAVGVAAALPWAGAQVVREVANPIPGVVHAFEVSSGKFAQPRPQRALDDVPIVEHPDPDSVEWLAIPYPQPLPHGPLMIDGGTYTLPEHPSR